MGLIENIKNKARKNARTIVLPEGEDERVIRASELITREKIAHIILLGDENNIRETAEIKGFSLDGVSVISPKASDKFSLYAKDFYTEQNLTWAPPGTKPIAWNIQWNLRSPDNNDRLRLAPQWLVHQTPVLDRILGALNLTYKINFHVVQWDDETHGDYVWQMEHVYRVNVFPGWFDNRVYMSGFVDHTFGGPNNPAVVTEHQIGLRVIDNWYAIAEYRRNEYRKGNEDSLGLGVEYKINY